MTTTRLQRVINFVDRKLIKAFFARWVTGTSRICDIENALLLNNKTCKKNKLRRNFLKWKDQAKAKKRAQNVTERSEWMQKMKKRHILCDAFYEFKLFTANMQIARRMLRRAVIGVEKNALHDAMMKWKASNHDHVHTMHLEEITELQSRQEEEKIEIKRIRKQIEED
jgi:hypothetical protein